MAAYVRLRDRAVLRRLVEATGLRQSDIAPRAGISSQRLSQLITGTAPVIRAELAAQLEAALGVDRGHLFAADEPDLIRDYLDPGVTDWSTEGNC